MTLRFTKTALRQIDAALSYIAERSPQGYDSVRKQLSISLALVQQQPNIGAPTNRPGTRRLALSRYPYVIFYRVIGEDVVITRVRHTARLPWPG